MYVISLLYRSKGKGQGQFWKGLIPKNLFKLMLHFKSREKLHLYLFNESVSEIKVATYTILEDKKWNTKDLKSLYIY